MSASTSDFVWHYDVDDEHPIGHDPHDTSTPSTPVEPVTPASSSVGPSDRVRQLRGQPKVSINTSLPPHLPTKVVPRVRRHSAQKRRHSDNDMPPPRELRPKKAQSAAISVDSEPETDNASDDQDSSSGDDEDLSLKDKCVSCPSLYYYLLSTDISATETHK
jgi:hypothetical protein